MHGKRNMMSRHFVLPEAGIGPGGDIIFRKCHPEYQWYSVCLGNEKIGQAMLDTRDRWIGLSNAEESEWFNVRMLSGFATRYDAATFVIKHNGYWMRNEREMEESKERAEKFLFNWNMKKSHEIMNGVDSL